MAAAMFQLFFRASAKAAAAAFLALSEVMDMPIGFGSWAKAMGAEHVTTSAIAPASTAFGIASPLFLESRGQHPNPAAVIVQAAGPRRLCAQYRGRLSAARLGAAARLRRTGRADAHRAAPALVRVG